MFVLSSKASSAVVAV